MKALGMIGNGRYDERYTRTITNYENNNDPRRQSSTGIREEDREEDIMIDDYNYYNETETFQRIERLFVLEQQELDTTTTAAAAASSIVVPSSSSSNHDNNNKKVLSRLRIPKSSSSASSSSTSESWILPQKLLQPTRNHDNIIFDIVGGEGDGNINNNKSSSGSMMMVIALGRHSDSVQWIDLMTGRQKSQRIPSTLVDPAGHPLNNLNHVYSVVVDNIVDGHKEIWLPCGFHGHEVDNETSSEYVRIIHLGNNGNNGKNDKNDNDNNNVTISVGPKLPHAGGACVALPLHIKGPTTDPMICVFGGTNGPHDSGEFLKYTSCYDREEQKWYDNNTSPFGLLPYGLDHGSIVKIPAGTCHPEDPTRLLIFNFRTENYGTQHGEFLAYDFPQRGYFTQQELEGDDGDGTTTNKSISKWYVYANITYKDHNDEINAPRDASGVALAENFRTILNFGGIHYYNRTVVPTMSPPSSSSSSTNHSTTTKTSMNMTKIKRSLRKYSTIRSFDVCQNRPNKNQNDDEEPPQQPSPSSSWSWSLVGRLPYRTFALQTAVSPQQQIAVTCGGQVHKKVNPKGNVGYCVVTKLLRDENNNNQDNNNHDRFDNDHNHDGINIVSSSKFVQHCDGCTVQNEQQISGLLS